MTGGEHKTAGKGSGYHSIYHCHPLHSTLKGKVKGSATVLFYLLASYVLTILLDINLQAQSKVQPIQLFTRQSILGSVCPMK